jgi:hypothetical protein
MAELHNTDIVLMTPKDISEFYVKRHKKDAEFHSRSLATFNYDI